MNRWTQTLTVFFLLVAGKASDACTAVYYSSEDCILAACNLDWADPVARIWFVPAANGRYGCVYVGTDGTPAFGMNEKGLFFMGQLNSYVDASSTSGNPFVPGLLYIKIMQECANLYDVSKMLGMYNLKLLERTKLFFGDKCGNSLIAEGATVVWKQGEYQICRAMITQSQPQKPEFQYAFYLKADRVLNGRKYIDRKKMKEALIRTCQNDYHRTICSGVFDLQIC